VKTETYGDGTIKVLDLESEYLPVVVASENPDAPYESMKAQVIASRTFAAYKINYEPRSNEFDVYDDERDQVYNPAKFETLPQSKQEQIKRAVQETTGIILRWKGVIICAFFVSGIGDTAKYVTYNEGKNGDDITQTTLGWCTEPPSKNPHNRGCMGQVQANELALKGYSYQQIIRYFYGADIEGLPAGEIEGSGEVTVKPLFEITDWHVSPGEVKIGEKISAPVTISVTIKNNDVKTRIFHAIFFVKDPEGKEITSPDEEISIPPMVSSTIEFHLTIEAESALAGSYDVSFVIFAEGYEGKIVSIPNAFKVSFTPFPQRYIKDSIHYIKILNYGNSIHLITLSKEEIDEHRFDMLKLQAIPIGTSTVYFIKNALEVSKAVVEITGTVLFFMETGIIIIPSDAADILLKPLLEKALTEKDWENIFFGGSLSASQRAWTGRKLIECTAKSFGYVNFIIVTTENDYDVFVVTNYMYVGGQLKEVEWTQAFYIGRYTANELPYIIYEKLQSVSD
jgi:hypothetical protein